jgi:CheY-like chemotaxis protein
MLARALVELMRGRLAYETTRAGGTLATLSLPMTASTRVGLRLAAGARVLLVEDNRIAEQIAAHVLQQGGYRVHSVASGAAAVAEARQARYDLVLMDLEMPGMDGFSTTAALRRLPGWVDVPILALTAHSSDEARALCLHHGMCAFLSKPVSPEELLAAVARAVGR